MKRLFLALLIVVALFGITTLEQWFLMTPSARAQTNTFCAANLACTVTGIWTFSGAPVFGNYSTTGAGTHSGTETFAGALNANGGFVCKTLENVQCVDSTLSRGGSDIGAEINLAYAALPSTGGAIFVYAANNGSIYNFSTPIVLNTSGKYVLLQGMGSAAVVLNYTPTTATSAIFLDYTPAAGQIHKTTHGIRDLQLSNNGCTTNGGCGSSAVGIQLGQNAAGNGGAEQGTISGVEISGFGTGVLYQGGISVGSWGINWNGDTFAYNTTGMSVPVLEERVNVTNSTFITNGTGLSASVGTGTNIILNGNSFDANTVIAITNSSANLWLFANHFENNGTCPITTNYINTTGNLVQIGGDMLDDCSSGAATNYYVTAGGTSAHIFGVQVSSAGRTATAVYINNTTGLLIDVTNNSPATLTNMITNNSTRQLQLVSSVSLDAIACSEQGVPTGAGGIDWLWCDSATHRWRTNNNNVGAQTIAYVISSDTLQQTQFIANQGSVCTNGELALSAGWQSTGAATVTAVAGNGQTCSWTITTGTTTAANPTVTDTLTNPLPNATTVCEMIVNGGTHTPVVGAGTSDAFRQTTLSATAPVFTYQETPTAGGTTYFVTRRCGP